MSTAIIKPQWSFLTIALMVLGFIIFWPLGLAMLAYIIWGEKFGGSSEKAEEFFKSKRKEWKKHERRHGRGRGHRSSMTGNAAFDSYRDEQLDRLDEERRRLDEEVKAFGEYMDNLAKARDREEFDRFMRERRNNENGHSHDDDHHDDHKDGEGRQGY